MVQYYYRPNGRRGTVMEGPFNSIEQAKTDARQKGFDARDIGLLRKEGVSLTKVETTRSGVELSLS